MIIIDPMIRGLRLLESRYFETLSAIESVIIIDPMIRGLRPYITGQFAPINRIVIIIDPIFRGLRLINILCVLAS